MILEEGKKLKIEIKPFIATIIVIMASISLCEAIEYKTLDTQYFKAEYPANWEINELDAFNEHRYHFTDVTHIGNTTISDPLDSYIGIGLNGADIRFKIDPNMKGMFNEDGSIGESIIHFFETFQVKKNATINVTVAPEYKIYENEYFKVEYPVDWIIYPNEKKLSCNFQVPINNSWNVECYDPVEVSLGLNGATIDVQANKDTGNFLKDGFINESLLHFFKTFKLKSIPTPVL